MLRPFFFLLCAAFAACAGETGAPLPGYRMQVWTGDDGLPQNQVAAVRQTSDGFIWIGTWFGLVRFDGANFRIFNTANTPELPTDTINSLLEYPRGTLWIGTQTGLVVHANQRFERLPIPEQIHRHGVWDIVPSVGHSVWLHIAKWVVRCENGQFLSLRELPVKESIAILPLLPNKDGSVDIFTHDQWMTLSADGSELRTNLVRSPEFPEWMTAHRARANGQVLIGTRKGLYAMTASRKLEPVCQKQLGELLIDHIFDDSSGRLWVNARGKGLFVRSGAFLQPVHFGEKIEPGTLMCAEEDQTGAFWFGTRSGLVHLTRNLVTTWTTRDGLVHDRVWSVCQMKDGEMAVGSEFGLSLVTEQGVHSAVPSLSTPSLYADRFVWPASKGGVYTARNRAGVFRYLNGNFEQVVTTNTLAGAVTCIWGDGAGTIYLGTENGLQRFKEEQPLPWKPLGAPLPIRKSFAIFREHDGTLWSATEHWGLSRVQGTNITRYTTAQGLAHNDAWDIWQDSDGALWIATAGGLSHFSGGRFINITTAQGLRENMINALLADDEGALWLSGQHGIYRLWLDELRAVVHGRASIVHPYALSAADGMEASETNGEKQPAKWKSRDGRLWFPTIHGIVAIDPTRLPRRENPPSLLIENVKADDRIIFDDTVSTEARGREGGPKQNPGVVVHRLAAGTAHVLDFSYTANSFLEPKRVHFSYRLIGADKGWRSETTQRTVRYINLRPGDYRFEVKGANEHNVWNETPAVFAFYLAPHFYETKSFYGLCALMAAAVVTAFVMYRLHWQRRLARVEQQRALDNERSRIARDLHDELGSALTGLAIELDLAGNEATKGKVVPDQLRQSASNTRSLADRMRQLVWTVNPSCDNVSSLATFLEQQVEQFLRSDQIRLQLDFPEQIPDLPLGSAARYQIALVVREALTNVVRHSGATEVTLRLRFEERNHQNGNSHRKDLAAQIIHLEVQDNGRGLTPGNRLGNGLLNMRSRVEKIGGQLEFKSATGGGTVVVLVVPATANRQPA